MTTTVKCPVCGKDFEYETTRDFMFCQYCGAKIAYKIPEQNVHSAANTVNTSNINDLLQKAYEFEQSGHSQSAENLYNQILSIDPNCAPARQGISRVSNTITEPNVFVTFKSLYHNFTLQISIDNRNISQLRNGDVKTFTLPVGKHIIKFRIGSHRYARAFVIYDRNTKVNINYLQDGRNHIDITN